MLAVEAGTAAVELVALRRHRALVPVRVGEDLVEGAGDPVPLVVVDGHRLDGQRPVRTLGRTDRRSRPTATSRRARPRAISRRSSSRLAVGVGTVPLELVTGSQRAGLDRPAGTGAGALPDHVVRGDVEGVTRLGVQPEDVTYPVGLDRHDPGQAVRVVHLGADGPVLDELADRHQPSRGADQGVVRQTGTDLLRRRGADVEPDRRVEAEHLVQQHPGQLVREDLGVGRVGEVAVLLTGGAVGVDHPVDELLERPLPLRGPHRAPEVLGGDDVGRVDAPGLGNSTPRCSKLIEPSRQFVMTTSRRSHATSSYGCTPSVVQTRSHLSPVAAPFFAARVRLVVTPSPAISSAPRLRGHPPARRHCQNRVVAVRKSCHPVRSAASAASTRACAAARSVSISRSKSASESNDR